MDFYDVDRIAVLSAAGAWTDITLYTRPGRGDIAAQRGRSTELDQPAAGLMSLAIDDASGRFTPGSPYADLELTQGMPIRFYSVIGYRLFPILSGFCELPDTTENLPGVDNLITIGVVDRKQLLDGGRTLISNLAEYIMADTATTLTCLYPLGEAAAPWLDVVGAGPSFSPELTYMSAGTLAAKASITPAGGPMAPGDDLRGVATAPTLAVVSSAFPTLVQGYQLVSTFGAGSGTSFAAGVPLTLIVWVAITGQYDDQVLVRATFSDVATGLEVATIRLQRLIQDFAAVGANFGRMQGVWSWTGSGTTGSVVSDGLFINTGNGVTPVALQITYNPNTMKMWVGSDEFTASVVPTGTPTSPQQLIGNLTLGPVDGALSYFQVHVGALSHAEFLDQYMAGRTGLAQQRPDERISTALWYAGAESAVAFDEGSTYLQRASIAGKTAGQVINAAVETERGRLFYDGAGNPVFHARTRAYNL